MTRGPSSFKQRDMTRALKAYKLAGFTAFVEFLKDGTIRLTPMPAEAPAPAEAPFDDWKDKRNARKA